MARNDGAYAAGLAAVVLAIFLPGWLAGNTLFWGDLTYLHHAWRALPAQVLQAGRLPLWNPYLYMGMPMAATQQGSLFYPGTVPFFFFGFATAAAVFQAVQYLLAALLAFLWLRRRFSGPGAFAGALVFALGGGLMSRVGFLNHLAVLSLFPALFLFSRRPLMLALTLAFAVAAGYPPFLAGIMAAAWTLRLLAGRRSAAEEGSAALAWAAAGLLCAALSACALLPAAELAALSHRGEGIALAERLKFAFEPGDWKQFVSPLLLPWSAFDPAEHWWKCSYLGAAACLAALAGFFRLRRAAALGLAVYLAGALILVLGESLPLSRAVWAHAPPLQWVRYPGNMAYLAWPALAVLTAAGVRGRAGLALAGLIALELIFYSRAMPWAPRGIFTSAGTLVRRLQSELGGRRYLLSPLALESQDGKGIMDWKHRLYGLTNAPFRLRAVANFGDPLPPEANYKYMDFLYSARSVEEAARRFAEGDVLFLMTPGPVSRPAAAGLKDEGEAIWRVYRWTGPAPLPRAWPREDHFFIEGESRAAEWAFVSEPRFPGWKAYLSSGGRVEETASEPAAGAFQKVAVPAGPWRVDFRYDPWTWRLGALLSTASLAGIALYSVSLLRRLSVHANP